MNKKEMIMALPALALMTLASCKNQGQENANSAETQLVVEGFTDTVELELVPWDEETEPVKVETAEKKTAYNPEAKPSVKTTPAAPRNNGKSETLYVETEGAQGRVWGHVTMKGDRGSGTIHDWDENTLSVTVTRHGNELFAVDQNSRQYVFKLKK